MHISGLKLLTPAEIDVLRAAKPEIVACLRARQVPVEQRDYETWLDAGDADLSFTVGVVGISCLLTCDPERYAAAQAQLDAAVQAADRGEQDSQSEQAGASSALPIPLSPLEYEALETLVLEGDAAEDLAELGRGDTRQDRDGTIHLASEGAAHRARVLAYLTLQAKATLGGRITDAGHGAVARLQAECDAAERVQREQREQEQRERDRQDRRSGRGRGSYSRRQAA